MKRLDLEDAAQVLNLPPASKYAVRAEEVVLALSGLCKARAVTRQEPLPAVRARLADRER